MQYEYSCGAVVFTRQGDDIRYVIIRSLEGWYGFPKGHMEGNETERQTALREIREEVGLTPTLLDGFRLEEEHSLPRKPDTRKHVTFFLAEYDDQPIVPQAEELTEARLMTYEEAMAVLQFENSKEILTKAHRFLTQR